MRALVAHQGIFAISSILVSNQLRLEQIPLLFNEEVAKDLTYLDVSKTQITDTLIKAILDCCPRLVEIKHDDCPWLTEKGKTLIAQRHAQLSSATQYATNLNAYQMLNKSAHSNASSSSSLAPVI